MNYTEKNKLLDKISLIGLMAIFFELFLYGIDYGYTVRFDYVKKMPIIMAVFCLLFVLTAIGIFIYCKKKNKPSARIYAIEFLAFAVLCPIIMYWYLPNTFGLKNSFLHKIDHKTLWVVVLIYFVGRLVYACIDAYRNSNDRKLKKKRA